MQTSIEELWPPSGLREGGGMVGAVRVLDR